MRPLYLSTPVRERLGPCLRPGGAILTRRIIDLIRPRPDDVVLDAGCGAGGSMTLLRDSGVRTVLGLDLEPGPLLESKSSGGHPARADLAHLPLPDACLDLVLCECVWNLTHREQVLSEFARTLKPGARIALTDIYTRSLQDRSGTWPVPCCFSGATNLATVRDLFVKAGFMINTLEDHTRLLNRTAAEFVFAHGSLQAFWQAVTGDANLATAACAAAATARPGLFLLIAQRSSI
jgi:ubiquinone/menaquinone biosynthesis C-methylase UbiE